MSARFQLERHGPKPNGGHGRVDKLLVYAHYNRDVFQLSEKKLRIVIMLDQISFMKSRC